jgi:GH35 family endo-1,4-beta-xylanase
MLKDGAKLAERLLGNFTRSGKGWRERVDSEIKRNRKGWGRVVALGEDGKPLPGATIKLKQKSHEFRFGCNLFKLGDFPSEDLNKAYEGYFKRVFNQGVVPLLWDALEPEEGKLRFSVDSCKIPRRPPADLAVGWCEANGVEPKGHWLLCDNFVPGWLPKDPRKTMALLEKRIAQLAERYGGRINVWDAVNEPYSLPFRNPAMPVASLPDDYVFQTFKLAERYLPSSASLLLNDGGEEFFGKRFFIYGNSPNYMLLKSLLQRGARVGGVGMQFHQYDDLAGWLGGAAALDGAKRGAWGVDERINPLFNPLRLLDVLDQYGKLALPISISEVSLATVPDLPRPDAEALQAELLTQFYRLWFSHESCSSIVWWNLCDKTAYGEESKFDAGLI